MKKAVLFVLALVLFGPPLLLLVLSSESSLKIDPSPKVIGADTKFTVRVTNRKSLEKLRAPVRRETGI